MILQVMILLAGFILLVKGADWFVEGAASIAKKLGVPQLIVGLTIVAMGTSMPEAAVSITAALNDDAGITIGNVVGSNHFKYFNYPWNYRRYYKCSHSEINFALRNTIYDRNHCSIDDFWCNRKFHYILGRRCFLDFIHSVSWIFVCNVQKRKF